MNLKNAKRFKLRPDAEMNFRPEWLVDIFLDIHQLWFGSQGNGFYGRKEEMRKVLNLWFEGREPILHEEIYIVHKFENEFLKVFFEEEKVEMANVPANRPRGG